MKNKTCVRCNDGFKMEKNLRSEEKHYCPYCRVVILGEPDEKWLPSVKSDEIKNRGFQKRNG